MPTRWTNRYDFGCPRITVCIRAGVVHACRDYVVDSDNNLQERKVSIQFHSPYISSDSHHTNSFKMKNRDAKKAKNPRFFIPTFLYVNVYHHLVIGFALEIFLLKITI